jgi:sulfate adenylyltransferase subunit 2
MVLTWCSAARGATRKKPRQGARVFVPRPGHRWDPKAQRPELWSLYNTASGRRKHPRVSDQQLDRTGHLAIHHAENIPIVPLYFAAAAGGGARRHAGSWWTTSACRWHRANRRRCAGALPHAGLLAAERRHRSTPTPWSHDRRNPQCPQFRAAGPLIDSDQPGSMEKKKQEGYF